MPVRERHLLDRMLGAVAGGALVGIPVALFFDWPWQVTMGIVVIAGGVGGLCGDRFLDWVADSAWWELIRGYWTRW